MKKLLFSTMLLGFALITVSTSLFAQANSSFPTCSDKSGHRKKFGLRFGIRVPQGSKFKRGGDIDFSSISLSFGKAHQRVWMSGMSGPNATGGQPTKRVLDSSEQLLKSEWTSGQIVGTDYRGVSKDGTRWRYLGFFGEAIWYNDMSTEAASFFDKVFDDVCFYSEK